MEHNKKIVQGDSLLPPLAEGETPFFSVLHTNHFTMICRCFIYRWTTTKEVRELGVTDADGRLSLTRLHDVDPAFARYITEGHRATRLKSSIIEAPSLMKTIVAAHNHDVGMGETEGQLLAAAQDAVREKRGGVAQRAKVLEVAFPNLSHYCEPILQFAEVFSGGAAPFLNDLVFFHSEHIMGLGIRALPAFWSGLACIPVKCGWAAVAIAKLNWSADKARGGISCAVPLKRLMSLQKQKGILLEEMHQVLMAFRKEHGDNLENIPQKAKARVLGRLDVLAGQIVVEECAQCAWRPGVSSSVAEPLMLKVKSLKDCVTIARYDLFHNLHKHCGGVAPDAADLASLEEVFPDRPEAAEAPPRGPPAREFDASGNTSNERDIFAKSGFVQGSKVHTKTNISYTANTSGGVRELAKGQHGHIFATDKDSISIDFEERGLVTWRWNVFPGKSLAIKRPLEKAVVENIETPHMWPLHQTDAWQFLRAKAGMVQAIAAVAERVSLLKSYVMADNALPTLSKGVNLEVMLRPTRLVKAQTAIALEKPLLLLPLTCNIGIGPPTSNNFPSALNTLTDAKGKEMVISLNTCFVDPQKLSEQRTPALEFFWLVRKNTILEKCNMKIIDVQAIAAFGVKFPDEPHRSVTSGNYLVPLMVSTMAIAEGDELVCYWGGGAPQSAAEGSKQKKSA